MTGLILIWVIIALLLGLVYWKPGFRKAGEMVKLYPAGRSKSAAPTSQPEDPSRRPDLV